MTGFHQDADGHWVAELSCGHRQHVRHRPPFELRPWVTTAEGRAARLGQTLDCIRCDRRELPDGYAVYKRTAAFTRDLIPAGLQRDHRTKPGVWGRIIVTRGQLAFHEGDERDPPRVVTSREPVLVLPEVVHRVSASDDVEFHVEFLKGPAPGTPPPATSTGGEPAA